MWWPWDIVHAVCVTVYYWYNVTESEFSYFIYVEDDGVSYTGRLHTLSCVFCRVFELGPGVTADVI